MEKEIGRLRESWRCPGAGGEAESAELESLLGAGAAAEIDPFDRVQLAHAVAVCRRSRILSEAGRELFAVSRLRRKAPNDADRLKKYLARFGLDFEQCRGG